MSMFAPQSKESEGQTPKKDEKCKTIGDDHSSFPAIKEDHAVWSPCLSIIDFKSNCLLFLQISHSNQVG